MNYEIEIQVDDDYSAQVNNSAIQQAVKMTLSACQVARASLTIVITNDEEVRALNREFREVDAATDVLSFPSTVDEDSDTPQLVLPPELLEEAKYYLGDVIIAYPYSAAQAANYGVSIADELSFLTVHGVLHLLGLDHANAEEEAAMWRIQVEILRPLGIVIDLGGAGLRVEDWGLEIEYT